ncbi:MAG: nucleoside phosphorylase [Desulfamplus sp.]|nr:nucleoside phosphorylase [Desulfamplus sp.]
MSFPTWSDLNDASLIPILGGRYTKDLGSVAIMVSTDLDFRYIQSNCGKTSPKNPFFLGNLFVINNENTIQNVNVNNGKYPFDAKILTVAGPYLGSPLAVMILESLIARGVSKVVVVGWCGAISDKLKIGDILIPDSAICDEGTSRNYMEMPTDRDFPTVFPNPDFTINLKRELESNLTLNSSLTLKNRETDNSRTIKNVNNIEGDKAIICKSGKIWTTDAIFRETPKKIAFFNNMGAIAVEMECSALFAVAKYRKIDIAATLIVSDILSLTEWKPGFKEAAFKESRKRVLKAIIEVAKSI